MWREECSSSSSRGSRTHARVGGDVPGMGSPRRARSWPAFARPWRGSRADEAQVMEVIQRLIDKRGPWPPKPYELPRQRDATKTQTQDRQFTAVASTTGGPDDTVSGPNYPTTVRVDLGVRERIGKKLRWPSPPPAHRLAEQVPPPSQVRTLPPAPQPPPPQQATFRGGGCKLPCNPGRERFSDGRV